MTGTNGGSQPSLRDAIRGKILGTDVARPKTIAMKLFGQDIELRQPTLGAMMDARMVDDMKQRTAQFIIQFACVPGTDERIFEEGDIPDILNWPFGEDLALFNTNISKLTGVNVEVVNSAIDITQTKEDLANDPLDNSSSI